MINLFEKFSEQTNKMIAPAGKANELILNNLNQIMEIQAKSLSEYAELGLDQAKAALEIRDPDSFSAFLKQQASIAENIQNQFKSDMDKMTKLANQFSQDLGDAFKEEAKPEAKKAPSSAKAKA